MSKLLKNYQTVYSHEFFYKTVGFVFSCFNFWKHIEIKEK